MTTEKKNRFTVVSNSDLEKTHKIHKEPEDLTNQDYHSNPIYEKLLNFRNLQEQQKKRFSVDDLFKLC